MRLLVVGRGRMGNLVGQLAPEYGFEVAGTADIGDDLDATIAASRPDVAVEFSTADAVLANLPVLAARGVNVIEGTTGWQKHEAEMRRVVDSRGIGIVASANFSTGVALFEAIVSRAAQAFAAQTEFGAWLHEAHHAAKLDAPSGTAILLKAAMERSGYGRPVNVSSTRAGFNPGEHTVGFDGPAESITLTHTTRDRSTFARGALQAAKWVHGRRGWFTMRDVLGLK